MLKAIEGKKSAPEHMSLYPTMDSTTDAVTFIESQVPVMDRNKMFSLLMMYNNTLLAELNRSKAA
mgnify:FL=1